METVLSPPSSFCFDQNNINITSGALSDSWNKWSKGFKIYFEACELSKKSPQIQVNILLHIIGEQCRELYEQFDSKCNTVDEILEKFKNYFTQKKNLTVERHKFFTRNQNENESIEQYVYELKKLSKSCEFDTLCDSLIKDRLVCGISNIGIRERLLREPELTLEKAVEICQAVVVSKTYSEKICTETSKSSYNINDDNNICRIESISNQCSSSRMQTAPAGRVPGAVAGSWQSANHNYGSAEAGYGGRIPVRYKHAVAAPRQSGVRGNGNNNIKRHSLSKCTRCGSKHDKYSCPAYGKKCYRCMRPNHFSSMCRVYNIAESDDQDSETSG